MAAEADKLNVDSIIQRLLEGKRRLLVGGRVSNTVHPIVPV